MPISGLDADRECSHPRRPRRQNYLGDAYFYSYKKDEKAAFWYTKAAEQGLPEAQAMLGRTPRNIHAYHPLRNGVIADYDVTEAMISAFINKAAERKYPWQPKPASSCASPAVQRRSRSARCSRRPSRQAHVRHTSSKSPWLLRWVPICPLPNPRVRWSSISAAERRILRSSPWVASRFQNRLKSPAISSTRDIIRYPAPASANIVIGRKRPPRA